jgi:hypothetical protein
MKALRLTPLLGCMTAATIIAGCSSPQGVAPAVPAYAVPQAMPAYADSHRPATGPARPRASWMKPGTTSEDLLYVSNGNGIVNVYEYEQHDLVGELIDFTDPKGECSDAAGNVYITDYSTGDISEYAHGGTSALRVINESPYNPYACAVSSRSGDLAVANYNKGGYYTQGSLAIYRRAKGKPAYYTSDDLYQMNGVAYDRYGDLFVTGFYLYSGYYNEPAFAYLPAKTKNLQVIDLPAPNSSYGWYMTNVLGVGWDGKYWIVDLYEDVYQYSINVKPELIGGVQLDGAGLPVVFYPPNSKKQATQAVSGVGYSDDNEINFWNYPAGGESYASITHGLDKPFGIAVSVAK